MRAASGVTPVERHGRLRVEGARLVGEHGAPVALHGASLFWSNWGGAFYNPEVVGWLARDWRVSVVRAALAVRPDGYLGDPAGETAKIEAVVAAAAANGVYVIVDWHAHDPHTAEAVRFFAELARRHRGRPNLIYETWNEPVGHDWAAVVKPHHEAVIDALRAEDPQALVIAGVESWSQRVDKAAADRLARGNVAYALHFYAGSHRAALRRRARAALAAGLPLFVSEWGASEADGDGRLAWLETLRWWRFLDRHGISQVNWSIFDKAETSAALRPGASVTGGWRPSELSASGRLVRGKLRRMNRPG